MGWLFRRKKRLDLQVLEEEVLQSSIDFSKGLQKKLQLLDFADAWQLTKDVWLQIKKEQIRSLVRLLFFDKITVVIEQTKNKVEINHAISCLAYLPTREVVDVLAELLKHREAAIQLIAAGALKNHTPRLVVPCLLEKLLNCEVLPARAGGVLLAMGYLAQDALLDAYETAKPQVQAQILEMLIISENPKCQVFLGPALQSEELALRKTALNAVVHFSRHDLWSDVASCLGDPAWPLRVKALEVLATLRVAESWEKVQPLLEDEDPWVRRGAMACLDVLKEG